MIRAGRLLMCVVAASLLGLSCGGGGSSSGGGPQTHETDCRFEGDAVTLIARGTRFDTTCLAAKANKPLEVRFDNVDGGIQHNFSAYSTDPSTDPNAETLFKGQIVQGPSMISYRVPGLPAGTYHFRCDPHPAQMSGLLVVR